MAFFERLFGTKVRDGLNEEDKKRGMAIVPLADREPVRSFDAELQQVTDANADGSSRQNEIALVAVGEEVVLTHEPRPRPEPNAIAVWSAKTGGQLGYLPVDVAAYIIMQAKRLDFRSTVAEIRGGGDNAFEPSIRIEVFRKGGN